MSSILKNLDDGKEKSIREIVLKELRTAIFTGDINPGDRLIENNIATAMGVSRTPVREALRQLESEGLAVNIPRKGTIVKGICIEDAIEIYDIREVLEGLAVRGACMHISRIEIRELREIIENMKKLIDTNEEKEYVEVHNRFNKIILDACHNKRLISQMEYIYEYLQSLRKISLMTKERKLDALKEHIEIVDAIEVGDEELAEERARDHVTRAKKSFQNAVVK
ncbi:GntR family transcriptional regulator [Clostridium sp. UBA1353]|uniref:GntR family transcriptional regulator n=1 Tax=Clostridium sp. UBA1353 TaxID=1946347 RepID=UPI003216EAC7